MKFSKNLKRLRNEKGLTQEQLAESLFISRQSVSSWENDRTQPDIEMLGKLSEVLSVSIEELIYGKKRNVTLETEKPSYNGTLLVVFSVLGAFLAGTGIVLIFVYFWQKMPMLFKAVLSFLPLLAGQGVGIYVFKNKRDRLALCEGTGIFWSAGIAATLTLIYNIFDLNIYWYTVLIFVAVSIIPVILLLRCVSPVIVCYACTITWCLLLFSEKSYYFAALPSMLIVLAGCIFTASLVRNEKKSIRSLYAHWVSIIAIGTLTLLASSSMELICFTSAGALGICLIALSFKEPDILMPYRLTGLLLTSFMLLAISAAPYGSLEPTLKHIMFSAIPLVCALLFIVFSKKKSENVYLTVYCAVCFAAMTAFLAVHFSFYGRYYGNNDELTASILKPVAVAANILLMISGGREKKLLPVNVGFISIAILTFIILASSGLSLIGNGLMLSACGAALLIINYRLSKKSKKAKTPDTAKEVSFDEQEG